MRLAYLVVAFIALLTTGCNDNGETFVVKYSFVISMENAGNHYLHVEMTCVDQDADFIDFKMPVWTPGYYKIQDLAKNVVDFKVTNEAGESLPFHKTMKNTWRVDTKNTSKVIVSYNVYANELAVVGSYLDVTKAFISPTSVFMYPDGEINAASIVTLKPSGDWKSISTGLDSVAGEENTFYASDFDVLFDCPILLGNQQIINFEVKGVPHKLACSPKDTLDKTIFIDDLTQIIETASSIIGEIPYKHYTFMTLASSSGGLEHFNSTALSCTKSVADTSDMKAYKGWLAFVAHEYFHLYNVKAIRPIVLGPFDYDKENYTNMLWVSEGITVYYEYLILNRAGIISSEEVLNYLSGNIASFENRPGNLKESATSSSFDAWIHFFSPPGDAWNNTISYYSKGCILGLLLDLKIRENSGNQKSLDDVMRSLYYTYYKKLNRGFTDEEFHELCETAAGCSLQEIIDYAETVNPIDYPKYMNLVGLNIDTTAHAIEGKAFLGATLEEKNGQFYLNNVERNSPARNAGLGNRLPVLEIEGKKVERDLLSNILKEKKAGDYLNLVVEIGAVSQKVMVELSMEKKRKFKMKRMSDLTELQDSILKTWLIN